MSTLPRRCACSVAVRELRDFDRTTFAFHPCSSLGGFTHGFDRDLALAVSWQADAATNRTVEELLLARFDLLGEVNVEWSPPRVQDNLERLLERPMAEIQGVTASAGVAARLRVLVLEDPERCYSYVADGPSRPSVSIRNVAATQAAADLRAAHAARATYLTPGLDEFFRTATLLLGPAEVGRIVEAPRWEASSHEVRQRDLLGAEGWSSVEELMAALRRTSRYVALRPPEGFIHAEPRMLGDVDLLCTSPREVARTANATKVSTEPFDAGYQCMVAGRNLRLDLHTPVDGYYDPRLAMRLLDRARADEDGVLVPRADDHFFSLLYHVKVHKSVVAPHHAGRLRDLGAEIGLVGPDGIDVSDDAASARVLGGYLREEGYTVAEPRDRNVYRSMNRLFVAHLRKVADLPPDGARFGWWQVLPRRLARGSWLAWLRTHPLFAPMAGRFERTLVRLGF